MLDFSADLYISSSKNEKVKHVVRLRDRRYRDQSEETIIEGYRELTQAIKSNYFPTSIFYCPTLFLGDNEPMLLANAKRNGAFVIETPPAVFNKMSYRDRPDGLIGVANAIKNKIADFELNAVCPILLVMESIEKPGNLGAMIRSADGVGVDAVMVCDKTTDINNPNVIRASTGVIYSIPVIEAENEEVIGFLKQQKINIIAAVPAAGKMYWEADYTKPSAIVVGSEQYGLSSHFLNEVDESVSIPMFGKADSLNVANAAAIMLYEVVRQRHSRKSL